MCDAAVLKIPQIARSVFFRQVDCQCYVKSGYVRCFGPRAGVKVKFGGMSEIMFYELGPVDMKALIIITAEGSEGFVQSVRILETVVRSGLVMVSTFYLQVSICEAALLVLYLIHDSSYLHG